MENLECYEASPAKRGAYSVTPTAAPSRSTVFTVIALVVAIVGVCLATAALVKVESAQHDANTAAAQAAASSDNTALLLQREIAHISTVLASSPYCNQNASTWKSCMDTLATAENLLNNLHGSSEDDLVAAVNKGMHIVGGTEVVVADADGNNIASYNSAAIMGEQSSAAKVYPLAEHISKIHFHFFKQDEQPIIIVYNPPPPPLPSTWYGRRQRRCWCLIGSCCNSGGDNSMFNGNSVSLIPK